jgi:hypothetical protein
MGIGGDGGALAVMFGGTDARVLPLSILYL